MGTQRVDGHRAARHQAAPAHGRVEALDVARVLEQLEGAGALARGDARVVERGHLDQAALAGELRRAALALLAVGPDGNDLGAVRLDARALQAGRVAGHDHHGLEAEHGCRARNRLGVIPGGVRDDADAVLREAQHAVERAAQLERAGGLKGLRLEQQLAIGARPVAQQGRAQDVRRDAARRVAHRVEIERSGRRGRLGHGTCGSSSGPDAGHGRRLQRRPEGVARVGSGAPAGPRIDARSS
jgi:hypothetical protein